MSLPVVLLGGAGLPAWIWDDVRHGLGDTTVAARPQRRDASLEHYAAAALADVAWPRFVLVAHSIGGVVAQAMLAAAPERVAAVLGVAAPWPDPGRSFAGAMPPPQRWILPSLLRIAGTRPPERQIRGVLCHGLPDATADRVIADFAPESRRLYTDAAPRWTLPARRGYLRTTRDRTVPAAVQDRAADTLGHDLCRDLATGHLPMLSDPIGVRSAIEELAG